MIKEKGELKVESVYGEGSTFHFELEQQIVDMEPIGNLDSEQVTAITENLMKKLL